MSIWQITRKDLKLLLRDLRTAFTLLALPLVFITIIGLTTGQLLGWRSENQLLRIAFVDDVDYDGVEAEGLRAAGRPLSPTWGRNIVTKLVDNVQELNGIVVRPAEDRQAALRMVAENQANVALIVGPEFLSRTLNLSFEELVNRDSGPLAEGPPGLGMSVESETPESTTHSILESMILMHTVWTIEPYLLCAYRMQAGDGISPTQAMTRNARIQQQCSELTAEGGQLLQEREFLEKTPGDHTVRFYEELIPGYVVLFAFFLVNIMARSFIEEQSLGTLRRLRVAPVRSSSILLGKTFPFLLISLLQVALLFVCGRLLFGMSWGPEPWLLIPAIVGTSLAATALGLLVATLVENEAQVSAYATIVVIVMAGISGCFMPRDWLPDLMRDISLATPHAWALMAYDEILTEPSPDTMQVLGDCGVLVGFAAVFFAAGAWRFRKID